MKTKLLIVLLLFFGNSVFGQFINVSHRDSHPGATMLRDELNPSYHPQFMQVCNDTVISLLQNAPYFCFGGCQPIMPLYLEIVSSHGAGATVDSTIAWLMTDDKDGAGPKSALPDSMVPGHDIRHSTNRALWIGGFTPAYISNNPLSWVSPFSFQYFLPPFWADSGRALCFTPVAFDSTHQGQLFEKDSCFGFGQPIQKTVMRSIYTKHFFSCDSGINHLHLIVKGGFPQYKVYNGYGNQSMYNVNVNSLQATAHYNDTLIFPAEKANIISIFDSLSTFGAADGCITYNDTIKLYPEILFNGLSVNTYDNSPNDTFSISPPPSGAMRIDFLVSDPASDGLYLINANGDTIYSLYPLGNSVGFGNISDVDSSLYIYDIPLQGGPYRIVATNDNGSGWQDLTCFGLNNDGHFRVYDLASGDTLSGDLYPVGDSLCGGSGIYVPDTFGVFNVVQYNKTVLSFNGNPAALIGPDSTGTAIFSPMIAGIGNYQLTFSYNDNRSGLCDKDTVINIVINSSVGIHEIDNTGIILNNPVHDQLKIIHSDTKINSVDVIDVTGKLIMSGLLTKDQTINLGNLASGVFLIRLFDFEHKLISAKKIVKQ